MTIAPLTVPAAALLPCIDPVNRGGGRRCLWATVHLRLLLCAAVLLALHPIGGAEAQSCVAPAGSPRLSYFQFLASTPRFNFSLMLGATFSSGTTTTSANAEYYVTTITGSITPLAGGAPAHVLGPSSYFDMTDNTIFPFQPINEQLDVSQVGPQGLAFQDSTSVTYLLYFSDYWQFYETSNTYESVTPSTGPLIFNTSCPYSCIAPAGCAKSQLSYFHLDASFPAYPNSSILLTFSLLLGATFLSGTSTTSADAVYNLTTISGSITRNDTRAATAITTVLGVNNYRLNDDHLMPFATFQIDSNGISFEDASGVLYSPYYNSGGGYSQLNSGPFWQQPPHHLRTSHSKHRLPLHQLSRWDSRSGDVPLCHVLRPGDVLSHLCSHIPRCVLFRSAVVIPRCVFFRNAVVCSILLDVGSVLRSASGCPSADVFPAVRQHHPYGPTLCDVHRLPPTGRHLLLRDQPHLCGCRVHPPTRVRRHQSQ